MNLNPKVDTDDTFLKVISNLKSSQSDHVVPLSANYPGNIQNKQSYEASDLLASGCSSFLK